MKVSQIPYERYDIDRLKAAFDAFSKSAKNAKSADDVLRARESLLQEFIAFSTASALANCRFTLNTKDEFYMREMDYYAEVGPLASEVSAGYSRIMLESPFRKELEKRLNPQLYKTFENTVKSYDPVVENECKTENNLVNEYSKFMSEMNVKFRGENLPLSVVRGYLADTDRETRKEAAFAIGNALSENSAFLDGMYDKLVKIRTEIAKKLGYSSFTELGYIRMNRIDYDRDMIARFRRNVLESIVPVVCELKQQTARDLGIDRIHFYDDAVYVKTGNPKPKDGKDGIFANAVKMYDDMDEEIGAFMREMLENEAFDVDARDGKWGGGYCTGFDLYKQPFILANFNNTADDIDTITHEFGHAFAAKKCYDGGDFELSVGGMETAECHSMSMEFFCEKYMNLFFDNPEGYKKVHLMSSLSYIPYEVIVDEFQHIVYDNPDMTPAERNAAYKRLEEKYRPYLDLEGIPRIEDGARWQYQMHIFETPFYYIDYALAQTVALGFFVAMTENYDDALKKYIRFVSAGGTKSFGTLIGEANLPDPFSDGTLASLAQKIKAILATYKA